MTTSDRLKQECVKGSWVRKEKTCSSPKRYSPFQRTMNSRRTNRFATGWFRYYFQTKPLVGYINYPQHNR